MCEVVFSSGTFPPSAGKMSMHYPSHNVPTQQMPTPPAPQEVRDSLYPAREIARAAREAELQREWEERQAQFDQLHHLRQSFHADRPMPKPGEQQAPTRPPLPTASSMGSLSRPSSALPRPPGNESQTPPPQPSSDFNSSFSSLLGTSAPAPYDPSQDVPLAYRESFVNPEQAQQYGYSAGASSQHGQMNGAYPNGDFGATYSERVDGNAYGVGQGRTRTGDGYSSGSSVEDMNERIRRLSMMSDYQSHQSSLQGLEPLPERDPAEELYGNLPPSYASAANDPTYYDDDNWNSGFAEDPNARALAVPSSRNGRNAEQDDGALYQEYHDSEGMGVDSRNPNYEAVMYYGERYGYRKSSNMKKKAAKILVPLATGGGGALAGAVGGAVIGAAAGGVGAPVGAVIGAVVGGTAGVSAGVAATQNKKFDRAMTPSVQRISTRCNGCQIPLDCFNSDPFVCPSCQRIFCTRCGVRTSNQSETRYCESCCGSNRLTDSDNRAPTYRQRLEYH